MSDRLRAHRVEPHASVEFRMRLLDQSAAAEAAQMPAQRGWVEAHRARDFAGAPRPFAQELEHAAASRIGERRQHAIERSLAPQTHPSILRPLAFSASSRETLRTVCAKLQTWPSGS